MKSVDQLQRGPLRCRPDPNRCGLAGTEPGRQCDEMSAFAEPFAPMTTCPGSPYAPQPVAITLGHGDRSYRTATGSTDGEGDEADESGCSCDLNHDRPTAAFSTSMIRSATHPSAPLDVQADMTGRGGRCRAHLFL